MWRLLTDLKVRLQQRYGREVNMTTRVFVTDREVPHDSVAMEVAIIPDKPCGNYPGLAILGIEMGAMLKHHDVESYDKMMSSLANLEDYIDEQIDIEGGEL
jgi:hypothetical protein